MLTTGWDGRARVMYLPAQYMQIRISLLTVETAVEHQVRDGLSVGFARGQTYGPPVSIAVRLARGTLPADVGELLGARLHSAVDEVLAGPDRVRWARLDLADVGELVESWAPYRVGVPAPDTDEDTAAAGIRAVAGRWAAGLWTWLDTDDVRTRLSVLLSPPARQAFRDHSPDDSGHVAPATGQWELPTELAVAAAVAPALTWELRPGDDGPVLVLRARRTSGPASADLLVGPNDGTATWHPFAERPDTPGRLPAELVAELVAELHGEDVRDSAGLRFHTRPRPRPSTEPSTRDDA